MYFLLKEFKTEYKGSIIVVGINKEANNFLLLRGGVHPDFNKELFTLYYNKKQVKNYYEDRVIVDYNFTENCKIIGKISELKDEDVKRFVELFINDKTKSGVSFRNYYKPAFVTYPYENPKDSFISLLKSNNCFIKQWQKVPDVYDYRSAQELFDNFADEYNDWNMLPEDLLIIHKKDIDV